MATPHSAPLEAALQADVFRPVLIRYSDMEPQETSWLWPDVVPMDRLTLLSGEPGIGKSVVALDLAARVTRGRRLPASDRTAPQGNVVLLSPHDHTEQTVRSRLEAAGADADKVFHLRRLHEFLPDEPGPFSFPEDLPALEQAIEAIGDVRLVIVDPLGACVRGSARTVAYHNTLAGLRRIADRTGAAVVAIVQFSGRPGTAAFRRCCSNDAALTQAKSVWHLTRDDDDPDRVLLMPVKCNLTAAETGLACRLESSPDRSAPVVDWEPEPVPQAHGKPVKEARETREPAKEAETPRPEPSLKTLGAKWLRQALIKGPREVEQVRRLAAQRGVDPAELEEARVAHRVVEERDESSGRTTWALPEQQDAAGQVRVEPQRANAVAAPARCS